MLEYSRRMLPRCFCRIAWLGLAVLGGCSGAGGADGSKEAALTESAPAYKIVTTCGMVTDIVKQVVGQRASVRGLMGEGVDPHLYKPTRDDVRLLAGADVIFYSGLMLEGRMTQTLEQLAKRGRHVYAVTDGIDRRRLRGAPGFGGHYDPHVWMDVALWSECVRFVAATVGTYDPGYASRYAANAEAYCRELQGLDQYVREAMDRIPEGQRVLVTAHDAFGYYATAYGLTVRSAQGFSTESEAGVEDINRLVSFLAQHQVPAVFIETSVASKNLLAIVEGVRRKGGAVQIGGELFTDAMGPAGTYEGTYVGMMDHNATVIARALGGNPPPAGWKGQLGHGTAEH